MSANADTKRITLDIPSDMHRRLKAIAALMGITLKEYILGCVEEKTFSKEPTEYLFKAMEEAHFQESLNEYESIDNLIRTLKLDEE